MRNIPSSLPAEVQSAFRDVWDRLDKVYGSLNSDFHGRRIINAGDAVQNQDYITLRQMKAAIAALRSQIGGGEEGGAVPGSGGAGGGASTPSVPLPNGLSIIAAYAAAHPDQLANSCQDAGGSWAFMDGVVRALQAHDPRYGFNGKRGNPNDLSHDAISYYHGALPPSHGSYDVYVFDIIIQHCGSNPRPAFQNVTTPLARGAWVASRSAAAVEVGQTGSWSPIGDGVGDSVYTEGGQPLVGFTPEQAPFLDF